MNWVLFWGVTAPLVLGSTFTAGLLPVYSKDSAYLCLDMKLEDGSHRYGLYNGNIIVVVNIFGLLQDQKNQHQFMPLSGRIKGISRFWTNYSLTHLQSLGAKLLICHNQIAEEQSTFFFFAGRKKFFFEM